MVLQLCMCELQMLQQFVSLPVIFREAILLFTSFEGEKRKLH